MRSLDGKQLKLAHFQNMVAIAMADHELEAAEKAFLTEKAEELGLTALEVEKILNPAHHLEFIPPTDETDKEEQLTDAVYMSMINGEVNPKEYKLCLQMAAKLGLESREVDRIIELVSRLWHLQHKA